MTVRNIVAVIVAADSPIGRAADAVSDLSTHLPGTLEPTACLLCLAESWPCARFDQAAHRVMGARLRLAEPIPLDLYPRLWPPPKPSPQPRPPAHTNDES